MYTMKTPGNEPTFSKNERKCAATDLLCLVLQCLPNTYHMHDHHCHIEALPVTIRKVKKDYGTNL